MSKKRSLLIIFEEILEEIDRVKRFVRDIKSVKEFAENELVFYAVLKCLENIGEAAKQIPQEKREIYSFEWGKITALRNIIAHEYFGIDAEIIWDVIKNKLTQLETAIKKFIEIEKGTLSE